MALKEEEVAKIKEHLLKQLDNFPEDKRAQIAEQINAMTPEQLEAFIKQSNLKHLNGDCIFCSIIAKQTPSFKIGEDKENIAILELNPISKGHSLIVPKEHLEKVPTSSKILAQEITNKLNKKFNTKDVQVNEIKIMDHAILEVIPIYGDETKRKQASEEELLELEKEMLTPDETIPPEKPKTGPIEKLPVLLPRIP